MLKEWNAFVADLKKKNKNNALPLDKVIETVEKPKLTFWYLEDKPEEKEEEKKILTAEEIAK